MGMSRAFCDDGGSHEQRRWLDGGVDGLLGTWLRLRLRHTAVRHAVGARACTRPRREQGRLGCGHGWLLLLRWLSSLLGWLEVCCTRQGRKEIRLWGDGGGLLPADRAAAWAAGALDLQGGRLSCRCCCCWRMARSCWRALPGWLAGLDREQGEEAAGCLDLGAGGGCAAGQGRGCAAIGYRRREQGPGGG